MLDRSGLLGVLLWVLTLGLAMPCSGQDQPAAEPTPPQTAQNAEPPATEPAATETGQGTGQDDIVTQGEFAILLVREIAGERELPVAATMSDYIKFLMSLGLEPLGGWKPEDPLTTGDLVSLLKIEDMGRVSKRKLESTLKAPTEGESEPKDIEVPDNAYADKFEVDEATPPYRSALIKNPDGKELVEWTPKSERKNLKDIVVETGNYPFTFSADASNGDILFVLRYLEHTQKTVNIDEVRAILASQVEMPFVLPQFMPQISPGSPRLD